MICSRLAMISGPASTLTPVRFPPGRARLAIKPVAIGSLVIPTIGMVALAATNALMSAFRFETMTSGLRSITSAITAAKRSNGPRPNTVQQRDSRPRCIQVFQRFIEPPDPKWPGCRSELVRRNPGMNEGKAARFSRLLRPCDERNRGHASDETNERASLHSIAPSPMGYGLSRSTAKCISQASNSRRYGIIRPRIQIWAPKASRWRPSPRRSGSALCSVAARLTKSAARRPKPLRDAQGQGVSPQENAAASVVRHSRRALRV